MKQGIWKEIEQLYRKYQQLGIRESVNYDKYHIYSIITHSTGLAGSTMGEVEVQLYIEDGVKAKGERYLHHMMNKDLKEAYDLAKEKSEYPAPITPDFLRTLNAILMCNTGRKFNVTGGIFDSSRGEYRLCGITAGVGRYSFPYYMQISNMMDKFCAILLDKQRNVKTLQEKYELSFSAHLNLLKIHPWVDGNKRTARLLMNYIQFCYNILPTKIYKWAKEEYILSLRQSQLKDTNQPFLDFMALQLHWLLSSEIRRFEAYQKQDFRFMF